MKIGIIYTFIACLSLELPYFRSVKNVVSFGAICLVGVVLILFRFAYPKEKDAPLKVTTWDALGYYMYLPSTIIYDDATELKWFHTVDSTYQLSGGQLYQASKHDNGNYVFKYLGGVSIMQLPFFLGGHAVAKMSGYKTDGFSPPYQVAIAIAALFYCLLGLFVLRSVLLRFYSDRVTGLTLLLMCLATNLVQYVAIDSGQSHVFIFPLYAFVLYATIRWHETTKWKWAALIGLIIGLATISRPTEAVMLFIPLLWNSHTKEDRKAKWDLVRANRKHVFIAIGFGILGVLPQLIYWKIVTGSFVYDVGSAWRFLNPWFRVLFGITNGWFVYTPITLLFVAGLFFIKKYPFRRSVITFCLLNIWIIISWADWRYGATYSTRALVQSYPVFALAFAGILFAAERKLWLRLGTYVLGAYLIAVNLFQIGQYNSLVLNYKDMNWAYYGRIYLNPNPSPLDMSLLDHDEILTNPEDFKATVVSYHPKVRAVSGAANIPTNLEVIELKPSAFGWFKVEAEIKASVGFSSNLLTATILSGKTRKEAAVRIHNPIAKYGVWNAYEFYIKVPDTKKEKQFYLQICGWEPLEAHVRNVRITRYR